MAEIISIIAVIVMFVVCKMLDYKSDRDAVNFYRKRGVIK